VIPVGSRLLTRRAGTRFGVGPLLTLFLLSGCAGGTIVTSSPTIETLEGRLVSGILELDGNSFDCTWLVDRHGRKFDLAIRGLESHYEPLRLVDETGPVAAREGDWLRVSYKADAIGDSVCSPGVFIVGHSFEIIRSPRPS
jgi:hypothetical protein